jgi:hypothetical protein
MLKQHDNNNNKASDHHADEERDGESKADRLDISCGSGGHEDIGCLVGDSRQGEEQGKEDGWVAIEDGVDEGQGCHVYNDEESGCYAGDAGYDADDEKDSAKNGEDGGGRHAYNDEERSSYAGNEGYDVDNEDDSAKNGEDDGGRHAYNDEECGCCAGSGGYDADDEHDASDV